MATIDDRFSDWARTYEDDALSRLLGRLGQQALTSLQLTPSDRFIDVGCGSGATVRPAAEIAGTAIGVDACRATVERARELAPPDSGARFVTADVHHLPFKSGAFTAVACALASRHFTDQDCAVDQMARVTAADGRLCLVDLFADPAPRSRLRRCQPYAHALAAMRASGLRPAREAVDVTPFGPYFVCLATRA
ncbi:class I SAM-dependent methyltransferase [Kribbella sp. NBC_00889]|uniref:class I SAM-dependent methyltransferase n=1 Tax=Kribbella sp. NBC_00889 TaxID=2975974 RepID=UPI0038646215|nr:methyltransferase domain-containing protein [Kribbella sp. NBC_00889]